jgi:hypothetical protein
MKKTLIDLMSPEDRAQELIWEEQLKKTRAAMLARIEQGMKYSSQPAKRKTLYEKWRKLHGDISARESAKVVEAIIAGKHKLEDFRKVLGQQEVTKTDTNLI